MKIGMIILFPHIFETLGILLFINHNFQVSTSDGTKSDQFEREKPLERGYRRGLQLSVSCFRLFFYICSWKTKN